MNITRAEENTQEENENFRPNYFVLIPSHVLNDPRIDDSTAILFGRIQSLTSDRGYCFASDKYLANLTGCKVRELQYRLRTLEDCGYIKKETKKVGMRWERKIFSNLNYETHMHASSTRTPMRLETHICAQEHSKLEHNKKRQCNGAQKTGHPETAKKQQPVDDALLNLSDKPGKEAFSKRTIRKERAPKPKKPVDFTKSLTPEQKKIHDELIAYRPQWGPSLKSNDVCAWFLSNKWTVEQVRMGFDIYKQDASVASNKGRSVQNMGGVIVDAIRKKRSLRKPEFEENKKVAEKSQQTHYRPWMEIKDRYVKIRAGNYFEEIEFNLPIPTFMSLFSKAVRMGETYG